MNKVPKVIWLYDDRLRYEISVFKYVRPAYLNYLKEKIVYKICIIEERNRHNIEYVAEYGNYIPNSIGGALFRYFKDRVENVYQDPRIVSL